MDAVDVDSRLEDVAVARQRLRGEQPAIAAAPDARLPVLVKFRRQAPTFDVHEGLAVTLATVAGDVGAAL
jgi:hypothetical protein